VVCTELSTNLISSRVRHHKPEPGPTFIFEARFKSESQICRAGQSRYAQLWSIKKRSVHV